VAIRAVAVVLYFAGNHFADKTAGIYCTN